MLIGTAGHIDHGKTTLVKALTGVDADRLPEEKQRGITLDLGYAYTPLADGSVLGFIDVPGHERLIHNMLAGATGIDYMLLVVAADDGPMPQTREHLELIDLLGLGQGAVAITKCDRVDGARVDAVRAEVDALLAGTGLAGSPLFPVSAVDGSGIAPLHAEIESAAARHRARTGDGPFRLAIDRAFTLNGIGTVVTGTAHAGVVRVGDTLTLSPPGLKARVKSLHVQDRPAESGRAGDRCALALAGQFGKEDIARGMWLVTADGHRPLDRFQGELRVPSGQPALKHWTPVHVHLAAADIPGRVSLLDCEEVAPGGRALAEIILDRPTLAVRGDRFVLRDAGARRTVAGGRALDVFPPARHKRTSARLAMLNALRDADPAPALALLAGQSPAGIDLGRFAANWNLDAGAAEELWRGAGLRVVNDGDAQYGFSQENWHALGERLAETLAAEHERAPEMVGVERERLRRMVAPGLARTAFAELVDALKAAGRIVQTRAWLHLPEHHASLAAADRGLFEALKPLLDAAPYNPPRVRDVFRASGTPEEIVRRLFKRVAHTGELYPVAHDHYFTAAAVAELAAAIKELGEASGGSVTAAALRDRIGGGRKVAIQILEFFDRVGYTRRVRDSHMLRREFTAHDWTT
ncbi:MAG TPA: selenocysteine-specific translation elongation factor [Parasulfuritortus sp.]